MAEYNKGKFFWIKLTDKFLSSDTVDFLMSQKDGANYVVLYQMLCLKTVNNDGILGRYLGEIIVAYDAEKICRDCKYFTIDTVRVALELYRKLGLVYELENGLLKISNFENLIGSRSIGAEKKRIQRQNLPELPENVEGGQKVDICPPEIEIEKEIDKEKDIIMSDKPKEPSTEPKKRYARKPFVPPTLEEIQAYCKERNNKVDAKTFYDYFSASDWYDSKGNKVKSWKQKVITWENNGFNNKTQNQQRSTQQETTGNIFIDMMIERGEFMGKGDDVYECE
jgi:predicted phage replisome organizer